MRPFTTLALGLLGAAVASASDVESLTKDSFPDFVKDNDLVLAECKFRTQLAPPYLLRKTNPLQSSQYVKPDALYLLTLLILCFLTQPWW